MENLSASTRLIQVILSNLSLPSTSFLKYPRVFRLTVTLEFTKSITEIEMIHSDMPFRNLILDVAVAKDDVALVPIRIQDQRDIDLRFGVAEDVACSKY